MQGEARWVWGRIYSKNKVLDMVSQIEQQGSGGQKRAVVLLWCAGRYLHVGP